jgi:hypothetical protein
MPFRIGEDVCNSKHHDGHVCPEITCDLTLMSSFIQSTYGTTGILSSAVGVIVPSFAGATSEDGAPTRVKTTTMTVSRRVGKHREQSLISPSPPCEGTAVAYRFPHKIYPHAPSLSGKTPKDERDGGAGWGRVRGERYRN